MLNKQDKYVKISEIVFEKGKTYGQTLSALAKYSIDHNEWDDVYNIIQNDPKSYLYTMTLCLKYGYLSKFYYLFKHISFKNTTGYVETLLISCIKYKRLKQFKLIFNYYKNQINFTYNNYAIFKIANKYYSPNSKMSNFMNQLFCENAKKEIAELYHKYFTSNVNDPFMIALLFDNYKEMYSFLNMLRSLYERILFSINNKNCQRNCTNDL